MKITIGSRFVLPEYEDYQFEIIAASSATGIIETLAIYLRKKRRGKHYVLLTKEDLSNAVWIK